MVYLFVIFNWEVVAQDEKELVSSTIIFEAACWSDQKRQL